MIRVEIVEATLASDETLRTIFRIEAASDPWRWDTEQQAVGFMRHPPLSVHRLHWMAFDDDEPVGVARLNLSEGSLAWLNLDVLPERRRRGAGRALFDAAHAAAGERAIGGHHATADGAAFAAALGARNEQRDVRSELELSTARLGDPLLPAGYELRSWVGPAPEELLASFASARNAIDDAPAPEGETHAGWTVERVRDREDSLARRGREPRVTTALRGGEVVAFTELVVGAAPARKAATDDTATVAEHRGRGLARAVKSESLRLLRRDRPDAEVVTTLNAEGNGPMRAINTKLGFVPVATLTTAVLRPS